MSKFKPLTTLILIVLSLSGLACHAQEKSKQDSIPLPISMLGTWQVTAVLIDQGNSRWNQQRDDKYNIHKYLGRLFTVTPKRLSINTPYDKPCENPKLSSYKTTAAKIIEKSISTRFPEPSFPTPQDLQLPLANDEPTEVLYLSCKDIFRAKDLGAKASIDRSDVVWFINLGNNQLAMSWHEETVLILNSLRDNAKPVASFNCTRAGTDVEKTICGSVGLAAYDQSVAKTYKSALAYYRSKQNTKSIIAELKKSQRAWLKQRNACGTNVTCLEKAMSDRIGDIDYDLGDYTYQNR